MKKYLSDTEILNWNERLENTPYLVMPKYHTRSSFPAIVFKQKLKYNPQSEVLTLDPHMKFQFSFSIAKNRVDNFFNIFNKWFTDKIETETYFEDSSNNSKLSNIQITESIIKSKKQSEHKIKDKEYTKFTYQFDGQLSSIMAYVMFLEDTIEIFSKIWGYDEKGGEHKLTKYTIGDIITKLGDQSEDYLILDFCPHKNGKDFIIDYEICKMIQKGQIIQYGSPEIIAEKGINWSRNNRIDDILDN